MSPAKSDKVSNQKFVFITGGVVSALGKGLLAASLGALLEAKKYRITLIKCDPYLNVDPGTMSPFQHGEVYVTRDGAETDMDLGHYERFTHVSLGRNNSITTGQVYENVILKERQGFYLGHTVQVIPHITDEIKARLHSVARGSEIVIVEIGGTIGDIESLPFIEGHSPDASGSGGPEHGFYSFNAFALCVFSRGGEKQTHPALCESLKRSGHSAGFFNLPK